MHIETLVPATLLGLRPRFLERGRDVRLVGGAVRDALLGTIPSDLDLATDATPAEQLSIYVDAGLRHVPTGIEHGTVTVVLEGEPYEITSLRTERDHDGRHAVVEHTSDWIEDLSRRDLTINAIMLTLDGTFVDPFGGRDDLAAGRVRFVGDPTRRMREDYLRILRWLRFHARFAGDAPLDPDAAAAARANAEGMARLSGERVWKEVGSALSAPRPPRILDAMDDLGLSRHVGLPTGSCDRLRSAHANHAWKVERGLAPATSRPDPAHLLAAYLSDPETRSPDESTAAVVELASKWRWSSQDRDGATFVAARTADAGIDLRRLVALEGAAVTRVVDLALLQGRETEALELAGWDVPRFPVSGVDLREEGMKPGPAMGARIKAMKEAWAESGYRAERDELMAGTSASPGPRP